MRRLAIFSLLLVCALDSFAYGLSIQALFHPFDPTLERIAERIKASAESIDIAMYSLDFSQGNPVIAALGAAEAQARIQRGSLKVRMIYEGYDGEAAALKISHNLEELGIDVRFLASGIKVHHKFAIFDYGRDSRVLFTGSANWSLTSYKHYNESILQIKDAPRLIQDFQWEFDRLWAASTEVGNALVGDIQHEPLPAPQPEAVSVSFNSDNFTFAGLSISKNNEVEGFTLTRQLVHAIENAQQSIKIATTRIQLRPIFAALIQAAQRGVAVQIIVNMDQYAFANQRKNWKLRACADVYDRVCSSGINFSYFLSELSPLPAAEKIQLRIKFTHLNPAHFLPKQMHSKYIVIDDRRVATGSFNWSYSGEYGNFENLVQFDGAAFNEARDAFLIDFQRLFAMGRHEYAPLVQRLKQALASGQTTDCGFEPMALSFTEIDALLAIGLPYGVALKAACR